MPTAPTAAAAPVAVVGALSPRVAAGPFSSPRPAGPPAGWLGLPAGVFPGCAVWRCPAVGPGRGAGSAPWSSSGSAEPKRSGWFWPGSGSRSTWTSMGPIRSSVPSATTSVPFGAGGGEPLAAVAAVAGAMSTAMIVEASVAAVSAARTRSPFGARRSGSAGHRRVRGGWSDGTARLRSLGAGSAVSVPRPRRGNAPRRRHPTRIRGRKGGHLARGASSGPAPSGPAAVGGPPGARVGQADRPACISQTRTSAGSTPVTCWPPTAVNLTASPSCSRPAPSRLTSPRATKRCR